jgi:hypothetical protein
MPKRTMWLVTGVALGAGSSLWVERRVRRTVQQAAAKLQPDALVLEVGRSARQVAGSAGNRVRDALSSGRDEMERHEEELWAELAQRGVDAAGARATGAPESAAPDYAAPDSGTTEIHPPDTHPGRPRSSRGATIRGALKRPLANSASHLDN